jgi:transcriptional regulator with XRE-family HTH domain
MKSKDKEQKEIDLYVGKRLIMLREQHQLTQKRLGEILGVKLAEVSHYERGRRSLGIHQIVRLRDHLGIDPNDLLPPRAKPRIKKEE